MFNYQCLMNN